MKFSIIVIALVQKSVLISAQQSLESLFNVDSTTCASRMADLEQFVGDAAQMAEAALRMYNTAMQTKAPRYARAYLEGLLRIPLAQQTTGNTATHQAILQRAYDFLWLGIQPSSMKATLFCDDSFMSRVYPNDNALQADGKPVTDVNGNALSIANEYRDQINQRTQGGIPPRIFYAPTIHRYFFLSERSFHSSDTPICTKRMFGETFYVEPGAATPIIILCPESFTEGAQRIIGDVAPNPIRGDDSVIQNLLQIRPYSLTLLHEIYHYAPYVGPKNIRVVDKGYELEILTLSFKDATRNADSYAYLALGAWYTYNIKVPNPNSPQNQVV